MRDPEKIGQIVSAMTKVLHKPVTIKIRKGFSADQINAVEVAKRAEDAGAAAIAIHGRTREEYYSGHADYDIIRQVKEAVSIPVMGSGDIYKGKDAKRMLDETGCDAVMIARGARGNPWIFEQCKAAFSGEPVPERPDPTDAKACRLLRDRLPGCLKDPAGSQLVCYFFRPGKNIDKVGRVIYNAHDCEGCLVLKNYQAFIFFAVFISSKQ